MNPEEPNVDAPLASLRAAMQSVEAPAGLDAVLAARFRRHHKVQRPRLWWLPPLALAATVAAVTWIVRSPMTAPIVPAAVIESDSGPFLALKPLERIALEPGTTVVSSEFPRALLADWGLPVSPERAGELVRAETLYAPDGEMLAIRLIN